MHGDHKVDGLISWESIGRTAHFHKKNCERVDDCMEKAPQVLPDCTPLLEAIRKIAEEEVVLVSDSNKRIVGLVTTADVLERYDSMAERFILLEEIENRLRHLINGAGYSLEELQAAKDPKSERTIGSVSDLTFGGYVQLFGGSDKWLAGNNNIDRNYFLERLKVINQIRNDVMHSRPRAISEPEMQELRDMVRFLALVTIEQTPQL